MDDYLKALMEKHYKYVENEVISKFKLSGNEKNKRKLRLAYLNEYRFQKNLFLEKAKEDITQKEIVHSYANLAKYAVIFFTETLSIKDKGFDKNSVTDKCVKRTTEAFRNFLSDENYFGDIRVNMKKVLIERDLKCVYKKIKREV